MTTLQPVTAVRLRPLSTKDLKDVVRIDARHTGARKPAYWTQVVEDFLDAAHRSSRLGLAAETDAGCVGYLLGDVRAFEFGSAPCGWVFAVGVDPSATRQGVGTALLEGASDWFRARGVSTVRTMVRRNDIPLLTFFRSSGFAGGPFVELELEVS